MYKNLLNPENSLKNRVSHGESMIDEEKKKRLAAPIKVSKKRPKESVLMKLRKLKPYEICRQLESKDRIRLFARMETTPTNNTNVSPDSSSFFDMKMKFSPIVEPKKVAIFDVVPKVFQRNYTSELYGTRMIIRVADG